MSTARKVKRKSREGKLKEAENQLLSYQEAVFTKIGQMSSVIDDIMYRMMAMEAIMQDRVEGVSKELIVQVSSNLRDTEEGFEVQTSPDSIAQQDDRVRVELESENGISRHQIEFLGQGTLLGEEREAKLIGLKLFESIMLEDLQVKATVMSIARRPQPNLEVADTDESVN